MILDRVETISLWPRSVYHDGRLEPSKNVSPSNPAIGGMLTLKCSDGGESLRFKVVGKRLNFNSTIVRNKPYVTRHTDYFVKRIV